MDSTSSLFKAFANFGREQRIALNDPKVLEAFKAHVAGEVEKAMTSAARLHGHRTQNMFEALVVSLDRYRILKVEDEGRLYAKGNFKLPDFMMVLEDGRRWIIEVKSVFNKDFLKFKSDYVDAFRAYAEGVACELKFAVYWGKWRIWTILSVDDLVETNGRLTISAEKALKINEMGALGDATIGTAPPLRLRFLADRSKPRHLPESGEATLTITSAEIICGERTVLDGIDRSVAWLFMRFGEWEISGPHVIATNSDVDALEFVWSPSERLNNGFEIVGTLSGMFARYFASQTLEDGKVTQIDARALPEWFGPLVNYESNQKYKLQIWKFVQSPNRDA